MSDELLQLAMSMEGNRHQDWYDRCPPEVQEYIRETVVPFCDAYSGTKEAAYKAARKVLHEKFGEDYLKIRADQFRKWMRNRAPTI